MIRPSCNHYNDIQSLEKQPWVLTFSRSLIPSLYRYQVKYIWLNKTCCTLNISINLTFQGWKGRTRGAGTVVGECGKGEKWTMHSTLPPGLWVAPAGDCCPLNSPPTLRRPPARQASLPLWLWDPPDCPAASTFPPGVCPERADQRCMT